MRWFDTESEKMQVRGGTPANPAKPANFDRENFSNFSNFSGGAPSNTHFSQPYPNQDGQVKCCYCDHYRDRRCTQGHQPDGISLLRECGDFRFNQAVIR